MVEPKEMLRVGGRVIYLCQLEQESIRTYLAEGGSVTRVACKMRLKTASAQKLLEMAARKMFLKLKNDWK